MIRKQIRHLVGYENERIDQVYWRFCKEPSLTIVANKQDKYVGIAARREYDLTGVTEGDRMLGEITNRGASVIVRGKQDIYTQARNLFAEKAIQCIPVISEDGDIEDIFTRQRAFYKDHYREGTFSRMNYAICIYAAAVEASQLGLKGISVCEFGVAGGRGLLAAQFHAREISRLTGVDIKVFGFDLGTGIPVTDMPAEDLAHWFYPGSFDTSMNEGRLFDRLEDGNELILGDIKDTVVHFMDVERYSVGAVFVDVDLYTSTKYILDWMKVHPSDNNFLPRVFMYFDDVHGLFEGFGEHKAIMEFNREMEGTMRISPEGAGAISDLHTLDATYGVFSKWLYTRHTDYQYGRIKLCHRLADERYNRNPFTDGKRDKTILKGMAMI